MNHRLCALVLFIMASVMTGQAQHRVEVIITGIQDTTGVIMVGLFADAKSFIKKPAFGARIKSELGEVRAVFENLPSGEYAMSIIHDANRNGKLDTNFIGIPREGFGFSNDAMGTFGPPSFEKAKFKVTTSLRMRVNVRYL